MGLFSSKPTPADWAKHIMDNESHPSWDSQTVAANAAAVMVDHGLTPRQASEAVQTAQRGER